MIEDGTINTTPAEILEQLEAAISNGYAKSRGADVAIAEDPAHAIELLAAGRPGGMTIVLFYLGDSSGGDEELPEDTLVNGQIRIGCVKRKGLEVRPGKKIPPVLADCQALRKFVRKIETPLTVTGGLEYAGMTYLKTEGGQLLHGYALTFNALYADEV
jgi:hypothetical protein